MMLEAVQHVHGAWLDVCVRGLRYRRERDRALRPVRRGDEHVAERGGHAIDETLVWGRRPATSRSDA